MNREDSCLDSFDLVAGEIVEDDDVSWLEGWAEELLDPGEKRLPIDRPVEDHRRGHSIVAQAGHEGGRVPVPAGRGCDAALASGRTPVAPRHTGRCPRFIQENQLLDVHVGLRFKPYLARLLNVLAFLLAGVQSFF